MGGKAGAFFAKRFKLKSLVKNRQQVSPQPMAALVVVLRSRFF